MGILMNIVHNQGQLVYHYTSLSTFNKIIEGIDNGDLIFHASALHCMNDNSEFIYGFKGFRKILPAIEQCVGNIDDSLKLSKMIESEDCYLHGKWSESFVKILHEGNRTPFSVSTSAHNDSIPMWAMYGDGGHGVAMGLDISNLYKRGKNEKGIKNLVNPDEVHALKIVQELSLDHPAVIYSMNIYKKYLEKVSQMSDENDILKQKINALYDMSVYASALVKHPAFKFEREWRIIETSKKSNDIHYKTNAKGELIPFIEIRIPISKLSRLVIGPCCDNPFQKRTIEELLRKIGMKNCKVIQSKVPYKGL